MAYAKDFPIKADLIGLKEAADYLNCSHQALSKALQDPEEPLRDYFRYYAGAYRTTRSLLDEFFTSGTVTYSRISKENIYASSTRDHNESDDE